MLAPESGRVPVGVFVGLSTLDVIHQVDELPAVNQKITARSQAVAAGGPATNAAVTFAALGGEAVLVTPLGSGAAAELIRSDLETCGVRIIDAAPGQRDRTPISSITVLVDTGERSVVSIDARDDRVVGAPDLGRLVATAVPSAAGAVVRRCRAPRPRNRRLPPCLVACFPRRSGRASWHGNFALPGDGARAGN